MDRVSSSLLGPLDSHSGTNMKEKENRDVMIDIKVEGTASLVLTGVLSDL